MGQLIVLDGLDGSGKTTQSEYLYNYLTKKQDNVMQISFPDYKEKSSEIVKMYLAGEFGDNTYNVNAYAASSFYAVDRYASYKKYWEKQYNNDYTILAARYTTSNIIHQMSKLPQEKWNDFINWVEDYEYIKLGLPRPDKVIFLSMSINVLTKLLSKRYDGDEKKKDIHENNINYLIECRKVALFAAEKLNWEVINCCDSEQPLPVEKIRGEIERAYDKFQRNKN